MSTISNEWELSKENIQPIQQGRKAGVLRAALSVHPEDQLLQKRRAFEQELRAYDGDDPLSVWCKYIKWVEQNYPKGGREGNIGRLIQQCLSILKDEEKYQNDDRFIDIWLKFANMSIKPIEVYTNMYDRNIGCKTSRFFISWAWEVEQLGNMKQADEILIEGLQRNAQPIEVLKSAHTQLEGRMATAFAKGSEKPTVQDTQPEQRFAFTLLKPQEKNRAPISRIGPVTEPSTRESLTVGHKQPQPKSNVVSRIPFKIYGADNKSPDPAIHGGKGQLFVLNSGSTKENEKKPSKWTKVKLLSSMQPLAKTKAPEFTVHCDSTPQPSSANKIPDGARILTTWKKTVNPPVALFEPPDPTKRPMYDKHKVYGGTEEYSFEEIHAAVWFGKEKKLEKERKRLQEEKEKQEMKAQLKFLQKKIQDLESRTLPMLQTTDGSSNQAKFNSQNVISCMDEERRNSAAVIAQCQSNLDSKSENLHKQNSTADSLHAEGENIDQLQANGSQLRCQGLNNLVPNVNQSKTVNSDASQQGLSSTNVENMVQELYNDSLSCNVKKNSDLSIHARLESCSDDASSNVLSSSFKTNFEMGVMSEKDEHIEEKLKLARVDGQSDVKSSNVLSVQKKQSAFTLYHDPAEEKSVKPQVVPFAIFQDSTSILGKNNIHQPPGSQLEINICEEMPEVDENVPPVDYVQTYEKREMAGILQPSLNVFFVPLEKQLEEQNSADEDDILAEPLHVSADLTMVPPLNTEHFAMAAHCASTPYIKTAPNMSHREQKTSSLYGNNKIPPNDEKELLLKVLNEILNSNSCPRIAELTKQAIDKVKTEVYKMSLDYLQTSLKLNENPKLQSLFDYAIFLIETANKKQREQTPTKKDISQSNPSTTSRSWQLSTIMENSREGSKSSSSSCSSINSNPRFRSLSSNHPNSLLCSTKNVVTEASVPVSSIAKDSSSSLPNYEIPQKGEQHISLYCPDINPFDPGITNSLLDSLSTPVTSRENFYVCKDSSTCIKIGTDVKLGNITCFIESLFAEGAYAKIYVASVLYSDVFDLNETLARRLLALKVSRNANAWEFYVCSELNDRLSKQKKLPDISDSIMKINCAVALRNSIVLVSKLCQHGTLLNVVNAYKAKSILVPECIVMYFTLEMLHIVSRIHECGIIHGDIKPDNFVIDEFPPDDVIATLSKKTNCLQLIDFGRAIDLRFFQPGITFNTKVKTNSFQCTEMKEGRPWVFQTDWYGVMGCVHVLLFSDYMSVQKNKDNQWEPISRFKRYWQVDFWQPLFHTFLNISSCYDEPDIKPFILAIEQRLQKQTHNFIVKKKQLANIIMGKT